MRIMPAVITLSLVFFLFSPLSHGGDLQSSYQAAKEALDQNDLPTAATKFEEVGDLLMQEKRSADAAKMYGNAGGLFADAGQHEKAIGALDRALAVEEGSAEQTAKLKRNRALCLKALERWTEALAAWEAVVQGAPDDAQACIEMADCAINLELYRLALEQYTASLASLGADDQAEQRALVLTNMGRANARLGNLDKAINNFETALALQDAFNNPRNKVEVRSNRGIVLWDQGQYEDALKDIRGARALAVVHGLKANVAADHNNEGLILKSVGKHAKARECFDKSLDVARELDDKRSEAIALSNRGLVQRMQGYLNEARTDYEAALAIYEAEDFREGRASVYLGLAKLLEEESGDYEKAVDYAQKALSLYQSLGNRPYEAEARLLIAFLVKRGNSAESTTRDLVFEDEVSSYVGLPPAEAHALMKEHLDPALAIAEDLDLPEHRWSALQGLGYVAWQKNELLQAAGLYDKAIDTVMNLRGGSDDVFLGAYLQDKEDLFNEAITVASLVYENSQAEEDLDKLLEYQGVLENEVIRTLYANAKIAYPDPEKQELKRLLEKAGKQEQRLKEQIAGYEQGEAVEATGVASVEGHKNQALKQASSELKTISQQYSKMLGEWKERYPSDAVLFDSAASVDVDAIQASLQPDEAFIQYFPLKEKCLALVVRLDAKGYHSLPITYKELAHQVRDVFHHRLLEEYRDKRTDQKVQNANSLMYALYNQLFAPLEKDLESATKLMVVTNKDLNYLPVSALNSSPDPANPHYLIQDYSFSTYRLSFGPPPNDSMKLPQEVSILAIANPSHNFLDVYASLNGALTEIANITAYADQTAGIQCAALYEEGATEAAWRTALARNKPEVLYFATHGMPYSEHKYFYERGKRELAKGKLRFRNFVPFSDAQLAQGNPLSGYLLMASQADSVEMDSMANGILTIKEIMELGDECMQDVCLSILSACNTAVQYSPKIAPEKRIRQDENALSQQQIRAAGLTPGIDQASLLDAFVRRGNEAVVGTLWFVDDESTQFIVERFFKGLRQKTGPEAMREAQLAWLEMHKDNPVKTHPFFWAAYVYCGR